MNNIPISYLLDMSDIEATNWLIENCHDYVLLKRAAIKQLRAENEVLTEWVAGIADSHHAIPDWVQQSARSLLANLAKGE